MVESVTGFLASDGKFFPKEEECEVYESALLLREALSEMGVKGPDAAFHLIVRCRSQIMRYLEAIEQLPQEETQDDAEGDEHGYQAGDELTEDTATTLDDNIGEEDFGESEEEAQASQPLPPGVREPVSDLGRHLQPTQIRHQRTINGPRGRQPDARNIRDGADMAVTPRRPAPKTRGSKR